MEHLWFLEDKARSFRATQIEGPKHVDLYNEILRVYAKTLVPNRPQVSLRSASRLQRAFDSRVCAVRIVQSPAGALRDQQFQLPERLRTRFRTRRPIDELFLHALIDLSDRVDRLLPYTRPYKSDQNRSQSRLVPDWAIVRIESGCLTLLLGMFFVLNILAGATRLPFPLLGASAAGGTNGGSAAQGFIAFAFLCLTLSLLHIVASSTASQRCRAACRWGPDGW